MNASLLARISFSFLIIGAAACSIAGEGDVGAASGTVSGSAPKRKLDAKRAIADEQFRPMSKARSLLQIQIERVSDDQVAQGNPQTQGKSVDSSSNHYDLIGRISSRQTLDRAVHFKWVLPENARIVGGAIEGSFQPGAPGEWQELRLQVDINSGIQASTTAIVLTAQTYINGRKMGNATSFNTQSGVKESVDTENLQKADSNPKKKLPKKIFF